MPRKATTYAELMAAKRGEPSRVATDRDYRRRRRDASVDPVQAQAETLRRAARWKAVRAWVLKREPLCRACAQRGLVVVATEVDHITPLVEMIAAGRVEE